MAYRTVRGPAHAEVISKKSRFLATVAPAKTDQEAWAIIERVRLEHKDATHNCFAFKAGNAQRLSDDGEPSGTAGRPIFDVIEKQGLSDVVVIVTRYFGGILLGAGGLVRAYSQSAVAGVEAAGVAEAVPAVELRIAFDYNLVGRVQYLLQQHKAVLLRSEYGQEVLFECRLFAEHAEGLQAEMTEAASGRISVEEIRQLLVGGNLEPIH